LRLRAGKWSKIEKKRKHFWIKAIWTNDERDDWRENKRSEQRRRWEQIGKIFFIYVSGMGYKFINRHKRGLSGFGLKGRIFTRLGS